MKGSRGIVLGFLFGKSKTFFVKSLDLYVCTCYTIDSEIGNTRMTFKELDKLLKSNGWVPVRSKRSHFQYHHKEYPNTIAVPNHSGKDIKKGTLNSILKQAGLK